MQIHYLGKWEWVGPQKSPVFWTPNSTGLAARCYFIGPTPSHLPTCTHQEHYARGRIIHRCINSYYVSKVNMPESRLCAKEEWDYCIQCAGSSRIRIGNRVKELLRLNGAKRATESHKVSLDPDPYLNTFLCLQ